jgi:hypothetical protein
LPDADFLCAPRWPRLNPDAAASAKPLDTENGVADKNPGGRAESLPAAAFHDEEGDLTAAFVPTFAWRSRATMPRGSAAMRTTARDRPRRAHRGARPRRADGAIRLLADIRFHRADRTRRDLRVQILEALPAKTVAEGVLELESDDAVALLEDLERPEQAEIPPNPPPVERGGAEPHLSERSAGRLMQTEFIAVPPFWNVGRTIDLHARDDDLPDEFYVLLVVDASHHLSAPSPRPPAPQQATMIT